MNADLKFKKGELCCAFYFDTYGKVDLFYCRIHEVGDEYVHGTLYCGDEWTGKNLVYGKYNDICYSDLRKID